MPKQSKSPGDSFKGCKWPSTTAFENFCEEHGVNRVKYQRIKNDLNKPVEEWKHKVVDIQVPDVYSAGTST